MDQNANQRPVRVQTSVGGVEGKLKIAPRLRTLDDLNMVAKHLVTLQSAKPTNGDWPFAEGTLSVNKSSIMFVIELDQPQAQSGAGFGRFMRSSVSLRVGQYDIQGFVHVPPGGVVMKRLDQSNHAFVSLTSALVSGPDGEFTTPFIAVNRNHIIAAQERIQVEDEIDLPQLTPEI